MNENICLEYTANRLKYKLVKADRLKKDQIKAIYSVWADDEALPRGYEVHIVRQTIDKFGLRWNNPKNEDFGDCGWFYLDVVKAGHRYISILPQKG